MTVNFDDRVVLVTGSSRGLGKAFAQCIGAAGGHVVINSTGKDESGEHVRDQIIAAGGQATHIAGKVEDADTLVQACVDRCGRLDAIVHNAGFLQDKTLAKMTDEQWQSVLDVHLLASFQLARAAWPTFVAQGGGSLVFISSASGLYGNFGQSNYAAAKMGMYGLARSIELEGRESQIRCNVLAPFGATEMNSRGWDEERVAMLQTRHVAPLVAWLAHPDCRENGGLFEASAGSFKKVRWQRSAGLVLGTDHISIDDVAEGWDKVVDFSDAEYPANMMESLGGMFAHRVKQ